MSKPRIEYSEFYENEEAASQHEEINDYNNFKSITPLSKNKITDPLQLFQNANQQISAITNKARKQDHSDVVNKINDLTQNINVDNTKDIVTNEYNYIENNDNEIYDQELNDDQERDNFEEEFELVKQLNKYKEENKHLKKMNQLQETQIIQITSDLEDSLLKIAQLEGKFEYNQNNLSEQKQVLRLNEEIKKLTLQINKQNLVIEKLKAEKQEDMALLKDKYNEAMKKYDSAISNEKKIKQELINKDKKILKLIEEIEKGQGQSKLNKNNIGNDKQIIELTNELKSCEKQKNELIQAFKQSMKLISILKRQKAHLEHCKLLNINEEKFSQLLQEGSI